MTIAPSLDRGMPIGLSPFTDFVFGGDAAYTGVMLHDATEDVLHDVISDVYLSGCFYHNGLCSKDTHAVVARRMASRLGVRVIVLRDESICLPFVAECTRFVKVLAGSLSRSVLLVERHGTPDTLFAVRFEVFFPQSGVFVDDMCAEVRRARH